MERDDLDYMNVVDAALMRRGSRSAYLLSLAVFLLIAAFGIWAHYAVLDEVTRGMGQVIPSQHVQVIQNLEGGILEEIFVQENQIVNKGDVLVRLSNETAASRFRDAFAQSMQHKAAIARLEAEVKGVVPSFPKEIEKYDPQIIEDQKRIFKARREQLFLELNVLKSQYEQKLQEIAEMVSKKKKLQKTLKLAEEQVAIAKPLVEKQVYPRVDFISLQREVVSLKGDIRTLEISIPRARKEAEEIKRKQSHRIAEFKSKAADEINKRRMELRSLQEAITAGKDKVTRTDVRSPVRGTIKQIHMNTIGGVIRPGETIMEIVPLDDTLLIEAKIRPADIAFIRPRQKAMIKITAYDYSIFGGLEGTVEQISADTIQDERGENFYKVKLRTKTNALTYRGEKLPIIPGMTAKVEILTGRKSVLDYLLKPILKAKQNAFRER
ncbi:MAG: HlyD family type I secretion periplasmic adaptor subunit [Deltaproteobacteria bacterium]|nr:HlyD family type I secretion periplasmic adaptor subunit [Deltaproteobacteria bacterium]MBW2129904.1 HlyD family type I secretion periplasmic adaptor subunit [Deltaproteobacteria bacterium]MBW2304696.1 HlyD family type I secretion periplasmic adaptor subunit [Deltaproteobacteria bacterium]